MNEQTSTRLPSAALLAFVAEALFSIRFLFFFLPFLSFLPHSIANLVQDGTLLGALLGNAEHVVLFPIIASLPAPRWARSAGYGWLVVDMATDIMALQGVPLPCILHCAMEDTFLLRCGSHQPPGKQKVRYACLVSSMRSTLPCIPMFLTDRFFSFCLHLSCSRSG